MITLKNCGKVFFSLLCQWQFPLLTQLPIQSSEWVGPPMGRLQNLAYQVKAGSSPSYLYQV